MAAAGIEPPPGWTQLRQRFSEFAKLSGGGPLRERLVDALLDGGPDADIAGLRAAALAEQLDQATILAPVRHSVLARLRAVYSKAAVESYAKVVEMFDGQAAKFVATTRITDVECPAVAMVDETDKARRAWLDAERESLRLTALIPALHGTAQLSGRVPGQMSRDLGGRDAVLIPLCVNTSDVHRRRLWEAWGSEGRCGRWSALVALGAAIRAMPADQLDTFEAYRPAKPMEQRYRPLPAPYSVEMYTVDPEDADYEPLVPEPVKKRPRRQLAP